jgi:hypothetical protein
MGANRESYTYRIFNPAYSRLRIETGEEGYSGYLAKGKKR